MEHKLQLATYGQHAGGQDDGSLKKLPQTKFYDFHKHILDQALYQDRVNPGSSARPQDGAVTIARHIDFHLIHKHFFEKNIQP